MNETDFYFQSVTQKPREIIALIKNKEVSLDYCHELAYLALAQSRAGKFKDARKSLEKFNFDACDSNAKSAALEAQLTISIGVEKDMAVIHKQVQDILDLNPDAILARAALGGLRIFEGNVNEGIEIINELQIKYPDVDNFTFVLVRDLLAKREYKLAAEHSREFNSPLLRIVHLFTAKILMPYFLTWFRVIFILLCIPYTSLKTFIFIFITGVCSYIFFRSKRLALWPGIFGFLVTRFIIAFFIGQVLNYIVLSTTN